MEVLSPGQREAIKSVVGTDPKKAVTYKEAADSLGISEWNLKTQLQRVRKKSPRIYQSHMDQRRKKARHKARRSAGTAR